MSRRLTPHEQLLRATSEADWLDQVIDAAHTFGWLVAHFRPARTAHGWRTPVAADGAGFPDLLMVRERVIVAELKRQVGPGLEPAQKVWRDRFEQAGVAHKLWRPGDLDDVLATLRAQPSNGRRPGRGRAGPAVLPERRLLVPERYSKGATTAP